MREEEKITSLDSKLKRIIRKKWVLPSIYIGSAALILTGVLWYQAATGSLFGNSDEAEKTPNVANNQVTDYSSQEAVPVNAVEENFKMPVMDEKSVVIKKEFYDVGASSEKQEAALVFYNNTYYPSTGIDIAQENGESFDVVASLSGTVVRAENDSILGNVVEVEHDNGVTTFYQSLGEMHVEAGAAVDQGEVIGTAGTSVYNKDAGVHVHFEIRQNNEPINPTEFFNKPVSAIESKINEQKAKTEEAAEQPKEDGTTDSTDNATQPEQVEQPADEMKDQSDQSSSKTEDKTSNTKTEENADLSTPQA